MAGDHAPVVDEHVTGARPAVRDGAGREQETAREEGADEAETESLGCVRG